MILETSKSRAASGTKKELLVSCGICLTLFRLLVKKSSKDRNAEFTT